MNTRSLRFAVILFLGAFALAAPAMAASSLPELRQRFKQRYPELQQLKTQGKLGETSKGYVEAVKAEYARDATVEKAMSAENADRRELYQALAKEAGTAPGDVAAHNAARNFGKAQPGEWLQSADGKWFQKK
jgi:uncharacterized protein